MSRATLQDNSTNVSLFPFLAVLLCTMGSLLLVLVVVSHISRLRAAQEASKPSADSTADNAGDEAPSTSSQEGLPDGDRLEEAREYVQRLADARAQAEDKLRDEQLRLSHIEDHMRRLHDQLNALRLAAAELNALEGEHYDDQSQASREVDRLQALIRKTREEIDRAKADGQHRRQSYSIVPYEGQRGTTRRPIYLECGADEVVFQPEGIRITPADLLPPLGPGNVLASTVRAAREYLTSQGLQPGETYRAGPYPLLIVRPDGVDTFHAASNALASLDTDFGYEMVDGSWDLEFQPADARLANLMHRAANEARARQRMLAEAAPRAYRDVVPFDPRGGLRSRSAGSPQGTASGAEVGQGTGGRYTLGTSAQDGSSPTRYGAATDGRRGAFAGGAQFAGGGGSSNPGSSSTAARQGDNTNGSSELGGEAGTASGTSEETVGTTSSPGGRSEDARAESPPGGPDQFAASGPGQSPGVPTDSLSRGEMRSGGRGSSASGADSQQASAASGASGQGTSGGAAGSPGGRAGGSSAASLASSSSNMRESRQLGGQSGRFSFGRQSQSDVPIRRTIQVVVRNDRLVVLSDQSSTSAQESALLRGRQIRMNDVEAIPQNQLAEALEQHIARWGEAGTGLYWRPVMNLSIAPGAEQRGEELAELLYQNGIEVRTTRSSDIAGRSEAHGTQ